MTLVPYRDPTNPKNFLAEIAFPHEEIHVERRIFDIKTYAKLRKDASSWDRIQPANDFLATFDRDEYTYLVRLFVRAKRDLDQVRDRQSVMNAVAAINEKVAKTFGKLNLAKRLLEYVRNDKRITMPDLSNVGTRLQDTKEKTFREDEYHLINTIVIISKMLFPIFGEIINKIQRIENTYSGVKEIVAFGIINSMLARDFETIITKLHNYISNIIDQTLPQDPMLCLYGITETSLSYDKLAKNVVKNFVNHDLYQDGGNIMRYLAVTIKRAISTETSGSTKSLLYKPRILPESGSDDGRNISILENAVNTSSEAVEVPILVKIAVDKFITDYVTANNINVSFFEQAVAFYKATTLPPTPVNELIVAMFVAEPIGSAYCVKYMNMDMMVRIIVIIQIYAMKMGFGELVPLLSMIPTGIVKNDPDEIDNRLLIDNKSNVSGGVNYYINLREANAHLDDFANFNFTELMDNLVLFIVKNVHAFNTAQLILDLGDTGSTVNDDDILKYDDNIISNLHHLMYHLLVANPERRIT